MDSNVADVVAPDASGGAARENEARLRDPGGLSDSDSRKATGQGFLAVTCKDGGAD